MKISEILKLNKKTISFEVFPPKSDANFDSIRAATEEIASLNPAYMSVTYGAGGGRSRYTLDIAKNIEDSYGIPTLAHLTCVSSTSEIVFEKIREMKSLGIENVMALRGDIPTSDYPREYRYAYELVEQLRSAGGFCIGGACYPEGHPESESPERDVINLKNKVDCGLDFLTTQMFFDNDLYYRFVDRTRRIGIDLPIIPGIMPITSATQVDKIVMLSGSYLPPKLVGIIEKYKDDPASMKQAGIEYAVDRAADLYKNGVNNLHIYSMNKPDVARAILSNLSGVIQK